MSRDRAWQKVDRRRWEAVRRRVLQRDGWKCRTCGRRGRLEVDHIKPQERGQSFVYDLDKLQTLCRGCHIRKTRRENQNRQARRTPERAKWRQLVDELREIR